MLNVTGVLDEHRKREEKEKNPNPTVVSRTKY